MKKQERIEYLEKFLQKKPITVLDGGLGALLETERVLWSAEFLLSEGKRKILQQKHLDFIQNGSEIIITATYQAHFDGFLHYGVQPQDFFKLFKYAVSVVEEAIKEAGKRRSDILIAGSIGTFCSYKGSEYEGKYPPDLTVDGLAEFHKKKLDFVLQTSPDFIIFETIPSLFEVETIAKLLSSCEMYKAWPFAVSIICSSAKTLPSGDAIEKAFSALEKCPQVAIVGVNCTKPQYITEILQIAKRCTKKTLMVYPNSGEVYQPQLNSWDSTTREATILGALPEWAQIGQSQLKIIGGCCRIRPKDISEMAVEIEKINKKQQQ